MNSKDIYLTDVGRTIATTHNGFTINDFRDISITFLLSFFVILFLYKIVMIAMANYASAASLNATFEKKDSIQKVVITLFFIILLTSLSFFQKILNANLDLKPLSGTTASSQPLTLPTIQKEIDSGGGVNQILDKEDIRMSMILSTEAEKREVFAYQKIAINAAPCKKIGSTGCTSVGGMSETTLSMLVTLKKNCNCQITISGGTEWWLHSATTKHQPGNYTAVDLRKETTLDLYIANPNNNFVKTTPWSTCYSVYSWNGFQFCDEKSSSPHWHIQPY